MEPSPVSFPRVKRHDLPKDPREGVGRDPLPGGAGHLGAQGGVGHQLADVIAKGALVAEGIEPPGAFVRGAGVGAKECYI